MKTKILKQGYFDCPICNERHMAVVPFLILENGDVICESHVKIRNGNVLESKAQLESSIFSLVKLFENEYSLSVKNISLKKHNLGSETTGVEIIAEIGG